MADYFFLLPDLAATGRLAQKLAPHLRARDMLALAGPLGAGKTTFARALLRAFDIEGEVPSPTFTLLQTYEAKKFPVYHFDLYRLKNATELDELGWDEALAEGLVMAEWPERAARRLPEDRLTLHFSISDKGKYGCLLETQGAWDRRVKEMES